MEQRDRFSDALLRDDMRKLNSHLPKNRRTLKELLSDPAPRVSAASWSLIKMKKHELEDLSRSLPTEANTRVKLPIVLLRRRDLGPGAFTVLGDSYEEYALLLLAGSFQGSFEEFREQKPGLSVLFKPQISLLMRRFHSLLVLGFGSLDTPPRTSPSNSNFRVAGFEYENLMRALEICLSDESTLHIVSFVWENRPEINRGRPPVRFRLGQ